MKYRVRVEIEYFITLCELPLPQLEGLDAARFDSLRDIYRNFSEADAGRIKEIESVTNHDVKAVEYFIKEQFDRLGGLEPYKEFIHFGLTSQDINNTSVPLSVKDALDEVYYPQIQKLIEQLEVYAEEWKDIPNVGKNSRAACFSYPSGQGNRGVCLSLEASAGNVESLVRLQQNLVALPEIIMRTMWLIPKWTGRHSVIVL